MCVISEILKKNPDLKRNTVAKVIRILEQKGYLTVDSIVKTLTRTGRSYRPLISREDYEAQKTLMERIVESPDVQHGILDYCMTLADTSNISEEFIQQMEEIIVKFKNTEDK